MVGLRFVVIVLLSVALDLSVPVVPEVTGSLEQSPEAVRGSHTRQPFRLVRDFPSGAGPDQPTSVRRVARVTWAPPSRPMTGSWVRKVPPSVPDSLRR
jgi:hypothetical protein